MKLDPGYRYFVSELKAIPHAIPGTPTDNTPRSWAPEPTPGAYSRVIAWNGRKKWCRAVARALKSSHARAYLAQKRLGRNLVLRIAGSDAASADFRTGRNVRTSHDTVAMRTHCRRDDVKKARWILTQLGFMTTVVPGRYLTNDERAQAAATHGGDQRRIASTRALTHPHSSTPLPCKGLSNLSTHHSLNSPTHAQARAEGAPRQTKTATSKQFSSVSLPAKQLAARLLRDLPMWNRKVKHPDEIARVLDAHPESLEYTSYQLNEAIYHRNRTFGLTTPDVVHNPARYLKHILPSALALQTSPPAKKKPRPSSIIPETNESDPPMLGPRTLKEHEAYLNALAFIESIKRKRRMKR